MIAILFVYMHVTLIQSTCNYLATDYLGIILIKCKELLWLL